LRQKHLSPPTRNADPPRSAPELLRGLRGELLAVVQGEPPERQPDGFRDRVGTVAPIAVLMAIVLLLGVYLPAPVSGLVHNAAAFVDLKR